jgi:hypothetical protein
MRLQIIFFLIFLLNSNIFVSQNQERKITTNNFSELELAIFNNLDQKKAKHRAKYKIKEITYFKRQRDLNKNLLSKKQIDSRKTFNEKGKLLSTEKFYAELNKISNKTKKIKYTTKFEYDNKGNLLRINSYSEKEKLITTRKIKSNTNKTIKLELDSLKITYYSSLFDKKRYVTSNKNKYKYDRFNRILNWKTVNKSNSTKSKFSYSYNEQNYTRK